jgi:hypothetical protein
MVPVTPTTLMVVPSWCTTPDSDTLMVLAVLPPR